MPAGEPRPAQPGSQPRIAVAASGGVDSTALLHCAVRLGALHGVEVHALHVHHGLQGEADRWLGHVRDQCRRWARGGASVSFHVRHLVGPPTPGASIEAWAREGRYGALGCMAREAGCPIVLLAHHRRDQAETWLLQALRGGGAAGLAAMPRAVERDGLLWVRPWLDQPRAAIEAYCRRWRLKAVHDPSNESPRLARSRLRAQVWPALLQAFPDAEAALAASARLAAQARSVMDEVAEHDLVGVTSEAGMVLEQWQALSAPRRAQVLRRWLALTWGRSVPETLVQRLCEEWPQAPHGRWPTPGGFVAAHRGMLLPVTATAADEPAELTIDLSRPGDHPLAGWQGALRVRAARTGGVPAAVLREARVRARSGGEQFQSHPAGVPRALKKQFQAGGVAHWQRGGPLVSCPAGLVYVSGLGVDARAAGWPGRPRVTLQWLPGGGAPAAFRRRSGR